MARSVDIGPLLRQREQQARINRMLMEDQLRADEMAKQRRQQQISNIATVAGFAAGAGGAGGSLSRGAVTAQLANTGSAVISGRRVSPQELVSTAASVGGYVERQDAIAENEQSRSENATLNNLIIERVRSNLEKSAGSTFGGEGDVQSVTPQQAESNKALMKLSQLKGEDLSRLSPSSVAAVLSGFLPQGNRLHNVSSGAALVDERGNVVYRNQKEPGQKDQALYEIQGPNGEVLASGIPQGDISKYKKSNSRVFKIGTAPGSTGGPPQQGVIELTEGGKSYKVFREWNAGKKSWDEVSRVEIPAAGAGRAPSRNDIVLPILRKHLRGDKITPQERDILVFDVVHNPMYQMLAGEGVGIEGLTSPDAEGKEKNVSEMTDEEKDGILENARKFLGGLFGSDDANAATDPGAAGASEANPRPTPGTQEEFDAIPSGEWFVDGDGVIKQKQ